MNQTKLFNIKNKHSLVLEWAVQLNIKADQYSAKTLPEIISNYKQELKNYFSLCALANSKNFETQIIGQARNNAFQVRVAIEKGLAQTIQKSFGSDTSLLKALGKGCFFGSSKKQGVSVRMPLVSCRPTKLCGNSCYAHNALDADVQAVVRGVLNGLIANLFECGNHSVKEDVLTFLIPHSKKAINLARKEAKLSAPFFKREPRIRFSHIGEITAYPEFANAIAKQVQSLSCNEVKCIVYTRHPLAEKLDPNLWVVNFSLDASSQDRRSWAPKSSRLVYSTFGRELSKDAAVNFLEHHPHFHEKPKGDGVICQATHPESMHRSCDKLACDFCFKKP